ncbi:NfeD family protein [Pseudobacteriovorax antillogorgiicola]|uniref:Membrane protein implicated in regulation of membrane protease activity n=1 Tax=Pseudobacteriovorax antillogorgiicola TaxID=1513793 RepID=A0A1Y6C566_9BACT|nr:NfeD family protein [Pseudobacteriovorax antillogorgiicola]TCS49853.1 membrane protein implicated in regulation of membrane protease activity [Pseudobacteriovorax antillogorgiicola]SMF43736.1 Membrane protein implicated in regulation of membrane protease activity [Pseudobacteriovorax antillogorgiicola]
MDMMRFWLYFAIVCIVAEFFLPGAVLVFIGLAASVISLLIYLGLIDSWVTAFTMFFICALVNVLLIRTLCMRFFPGESRVANVEIDADAIGAVVLVTQDIHPESSGRIQYRNTTWEALSRETLTAGRQAVIVKRQGVAWVVSSLEKGTHT